MKVIVIFAILAGIGVVKGETGSTSSPNKVVFCSVFAEPSSGFFDSFGNKFKIDKVDLNLCTHLIYIHMISHVFEKPWDSINKFNEKNYRKISSLKKKFPHLKVSLGFQHSPAEYLKISTHRESRHKFITSAVSFILRYEFDGLDLIWSYENDEPFGKKKFVSLVKELKEGFKSHNLLLSFTFIKMQTFTVPHGFVAMSKYVDFLHIHRNFTANLIKSGVPKSKIVITIEFLGLGNFGYYSVCELAKNERWDKYYDTNTGETIARHNITQGEVKRIVIPSSRSVANSVRFAIRSDLAGVMAYTIDSDDSVGSCEIDIDTFNDFGSTQGVTLHIPTRTNTTTFPLLRTINEAFAVALEEVKQEKLLRVSN